MKFDKDCVAFSDDSPSPQDSPGRSLKNWRAKMGGVLVNTVLPVGIFALLTGLFWIGDHGWYSRLFYWMVALPAVLLVVVQPAVLKGLWRSPLIVAFTPFACYVALTALWSSGDDSVVDMMKRPIYVLLLFLAVFELGCRRFDLLSKAFRWSAVLSIGFAAYAITIFVVSGAQGRLAGYGALSNPLLVSHVFGFFTAYWLGACFLERKLFDPLSALGILVCLALLITTGSRTPLFATSVTIAWLAVLSANRKAAICVCLTLAAGGLIWFLTPELITQRGLSHRNDIWAEVLRQIGERLWFGHGYDSPLWIHLDDFPYPLSDPHNLTLSVFFSGGLAGLALWLGLYAVAISSSWKLRSDKWVLIFSATVVYGLAAGMTEGGSFLPRPKEHWFLVWIPLALLAAATYRVRANEQTN